MYISITRNIYYILHIDYIYFYNKKYILYITYRLYIFLILYYNFFII